MVNDHRDQSTPLSGVVGDQRQLTLRHRFKGFIFDSVDHSIILHHSNDAKKIDYGALGSGEAQVCSIQGFFSYSDVTKLHCQALWMLDTSGKSRSIQPWIPNS